MEITKNSIIGDVLDQYPDTAELFFSIGMHCLGCPASRGETIEEACMFTVQTQTHSLQTSTKQLRNERRI